MADSKIALSDLKLIISTDRRIWAAGAFLCCVVFIWLVTSSWRETPPPPEERIIEVKERVELSREMIQGFETKLKEAREESKYLTDSIIRFNQDVQSQKEQIDWRTDSLNNKLKDVTEKIDRLATVLGSTNFQKARLDRKLRKQEQKQNKTQPVEEE